MTFTSSGVVGPRQIHSDQITASLAAEQWHRLSCGEVVFMTGYRAFSPLRLALPRPLAFSTAQRRETCWAGFLCRFWTWRY